ncbi:4864_t:CDS:2, partial [Scutellospora calospora]
AKKCLLGMYYWNWMRGAGMGTMAKSPIQIENTKLHYEFCSDLSIKTTYEQAFDYQPKFILFEAVSHGETYTEAEQAEGDLGKYKVNKESEEGDIIPSPFKNFFKKLLGGKTYLTIGSQEQLLGNERKGYYTHSESIIAKDEQGNELKNWDKEPEKYINLKLEVKTTGKLEPSFSPARALRSLSVSILGVGGDIYVAEEEKQETETPGEDKQIAQGDPDPNNQVTKGGAFDTFLEFE